jgi:cytochrome c-type biogenesis protein CcmF
VALGITGSSLGAQRLELLMKPGESMHWNGREIRYVQLAHAELPDKHVVHAELEITPDAEPPYVLRPARHFHLLQEHWTTEVAIHSRWSGDFYTILNHGDEGAAASLSIVELPLIRWLWFGGCLSGAGGLAALWPTRRRKPVRGVRAIDVCADTVHSSRSPQYRKAA